MLTLPTTPRHQLQPLPSWHEHVYTLLDMHGVVFAPSTLEPDVIDDASQLQQMVHVTTRLVATVSTL